jgi:hypothetical protein
MRLSIQKMNNVIERGPDSDGIYIKEPIAFDLSKSDY